MSTINATNIVADVLVGNTSANSITIRGEGSAVTNIQQGLAKCWFQIIQGGTHTLEDSLNVGSITDAGAGETAVNFSSAMANNDWSGVLTAQGSNNRRAVNNAPNTTRIKVEVYQVSSNTVATDATSGVSGVVHGDLA